MGKIFYKDKLRPKIPSILISVMLLTAILLAGTDTFASDREFELFDKGYEYYLSYRPEMAVETFTLFLNDFPRSSARDAALFWLGKSFLQLKSPEKAEESFSKIKSEFPESPFLPYVERESVMLGRADAATKPVAEGDKEGEIVQQARLEEGQMTKDFPEKEPPKTSQDSEKQKVELPTESKKSEEVKVETAERIANATVGKSPEPVLVPKSEGPYTVQVGALGTQKAANRLRVKLERKGYKAAVKDVASDRRKLFKVTVGKFDTRKEAAAFAVKLKKTIGVNVLTVELEPTVREDKVQLALKTQPKTEESKDKLISVVEERKEAEQVKLAAKSDDGTKKEEPSNIPGTAKTEIAPEARPSGEEMKKDPAEQKALNTEGDRAEQKPLPEENRKTEVVKRETPEPVESKTQVASTEEGTLQASTVKYTVQVGVFSSRKAADRIRAKCEKKGYTSSIIKTSSVDGTLYRVMVGKFETRREAEAFSVRVKKTMGLYAFPVEAERVTAKKAERVAETGDVKSGGEDLQSGITSGEVVAVKGKERSGKTSELEKSETDDKTLVTIKGRGYGLREISGVIESSLAALAKAGIKEVPWRFGDALNDFVNEEILFEAAKESGTVANTGELGEMKGRYNLAAEEADYLERYLAINNLVQRKMENVYGERLVESLAVKYEDTGSHEKAVLASMLQEDARRGKPFEELARLHPDIVTFSVIRLRDVQESVKDSIERSRDGEVSVVWTRGGYTILKPVGTPDREEAVKIFVKGWVEELKKNIEWIR